MTYQELVEMMDAGHDREYVEEMLEADGQDLAEFLPQLQQEPWNLDGWLNA